MNRVALTTVAVALAFAADLVRADSAQMGVAARCNKKLNAFYLMPVVRTSDPQVDVPPQEGFKELPLGARQQYRCALKSTTIDIRINVYPPQEQGMGQGAGVIVIDRLSIGGKRLIDQQTNFNWQVMAEEVLTRVDVTSSVDGYTAQLCYSTGWNWDKPFSDLRCEKINVWSANFRSNGRANAVRRSP